MSEITINASAAEVYAGSLSALTLRIYATKNFTPTTGEEIIAGKLHSSDFYKSVACTVAGGIITIPSFVIDSTTDAPANEGDAAYIFAFYNGDAFIGLLAKDIRVPHQTTPTTWLAITTFNATALPVTTTSYSTTQADALFQPKDSDLTAIAALTTTAFGRSLLAGADAAAIRALIEASSRDLLQNPQSAAYTLVIGDSGKQIFHPSADNNARTFTIPANASVAFSIGTAITFINEINTVTIAITSDTLLWSPSGGTGSRTLAANGVATAIKITSTKWMLTGSGLT